MKNKNIQDVVAEFYSKFTKNCDGSDAPPVTCPHLKDTDDANAIANWLTTTLTQLVKEVEAGERERIIENMHKLYPVPDMKHAVMWPTKEQEKWAIIGDVMNNLQNI